MMIVSDPRECAESANHDSNISENSHDEDCVVADIHMGKVVNHLVEEPSHSSKSTTTVDTSEVLDDDA